MDRPRRHGVLNTENQRNGTINFRSSKQLQFSSSSRDALKKSLNSSSSSSSSSSGSEDKSFQWPSLKPHQKAQEDILPERLKLLEEFYHALEASISLLNIRKATCSFSVIAKSVESSTQRRFLSRHLAQIKYIFPESLKLEEFTSWSSESQCFRKDLRIKLLPVSLSRDEAESLDLGTKNASKACDMVMRRKAFRQRLIEFAKAHPDGAMEIPEAELISKSPPSEKGNGEDDVCGDIEIGVGEGEQENAAIISHTAFNPSQLKKFPRSPSQIVQARHISTPALSHLPSTFKRHFSARHVHEASASLENHEKHLPKNADINTKDISIDAIKGVEAEKLQKSSTESNAATHITMSTNEPKVIEASCTPRKRSLPLLPATPKKEVKIQSEEIMMSPPNRVFINASKCETPNLTPCSILGNPFASPNCSTPYEEISTPSMAALSSPPPCAKVPSPQSLQGKKQRQAVIKALRFGNTPKASQIDDGKSNEAEEIDAPQLTSPKRGQPPSNAISMAMKSKRRAINRLLPFDSPKKNIASASFGSPKRTRVSELKDALTPSPKRRRISTIPDHVVCQQLEAATSCPDKTEYRLTPSDMDILQCLPKELLDNVQAKERKLMVDIENGLEEATRRKQMIAGLPKLFNAVRLIFQSANKTVFTCKDLTRMVLSAHPEIIDQGEIVEQLQLLVDFAPQWISASPSSTGDRLYRIDKSADMRLVSRVLSQAK